MTTLFEIPLEISNMSFFCCLSHTLNRTNNCKNNKTVEKKKKQTKSKNCNGNSYRIINYSYTISMSWHNYTGYGLILGNIVIHVGALALLKQHKDSIKNKNERNIIAALCGLKLYYVALCIFTRCTPRRLYQNLCFVLQ